MQKKSHQAEAPQSEAGNLVAKELKSGFQWLAEINRKATTNTDYEAYVSVNEFFNRFTGEDWDTIPAQVEEILSLIPLSAETAAEIIIIKKERGNTRISGMSLHGHSWRAIHKDTLLQSLAVDHPSESNTEYVNIKEEFPDCPAKHPADPDTADLGQAPTRTNPPEPIAQENKLQQTIEALADLDGEKNQLYYDVRLDNNYAYFNPESLADIEDFYAMTPCSAALVRISARRNDKWIATAAEFRSNAWVALTPTNAAKLHKKYPDMNWLEEKCQPQYVTLEDFPVPLTNGIFPPGRL